MNIPEVQFMDIAVPVGTAISVKLKGRFESYRPCFSDREWTQYQAKSSKTKNSWLLGRLAVKKLLMDQHDDVSATGFVRASVRFDQSLGRLVAYWDDQPCLQYRLSITHARDEIAFAVLVPVAVCLGVGADIEFVRSFDQAFVCRLCSPKEYATWKILPAMEQDRFITLIWSLKEAYRKAFGGSALYIDPRRLCMLPYTVSGNTPDLAGLPVRVCTTFDLPVWTVVIYRNNIN